MKENVLIIFDFFGVFCIDVAATWVSAHFSKDDAKMITDTVFVRVDNGELSLDGFYNEISALSGIDPGQIKKEWDDSIRLYPGVSDVARKYRERYHTALLTNASSMMVRGIIDSNNLSDCFDKVIVSSEVKMVKPDVEIFEYVLQAFGISADRAIMIDDNIKNIGAAKSLGFSTIHFSPEIDLERELETLFEGLHR